MRILFSPTKQMDFGSSVPSVSAELSLTAPLFAEEARMLNNLLKKYTREQLGTLMKTSPALTDQTYNTIRAFEGHIVKPAIFSYSGTSFQALDPETLDRESLRFASNRLCILSGMYGLLYPLDLIAPYRLEMKTVLPAAGSKNLTAYWKPRIRSALNEIIEKDSDHILINLASGEYSKTIDHKKLNLKMITFHFKEKTASGYRTVGMYAKTARGRMLRRILSEKIDNPEVLKQTPTYNYEFRNELSGNENWIFTRG